MGDSIFPKVPTASGSSLDGPTVFHYASASATIGIVDNKELWGSKIQYLNDDKEFSEYIDFILRTAENRFLNTESEQLFFDEISDRIDRIREANIFVSSFSEEGDKLSQWRGYCPNGGYSIGFDRNLLKSHFESNGLIFQKAVYNLPDRQSVIDRLDQLFSSFASSGLDEAGKVDAFFSPYITELFLEAPRYKHAGFREEEEWRVYTRPIAWDAPNVDVKEIRGQLRPIYRFRLPASKIDAETDIGINKILIAPGSLQNLASGAVMMLFRNRRVRYGKLINSSIPYNSR